MPELEDIKKNTGTAVPTEVSAETINPVQQPNININKTDVSEVATWTQPAQQNMQQPTQPTQVQQWTSVSAPVTQQPDTTVQSAQTNQTAQDIEKPTEVRDLNDLRYADSLLNELVQGYPIYWNWMAVDSARARYNQYNALNGMTYQQIWDAVLTGEIAQNWTSMQDLKRYNPWLYDQTINYLINQKWVDTLNQLWQNLYNNYSWVETNSNYLKQTIQQETDTTKSIITTYSDDLIDFIKSYSTNATALMWLASNMLNSPEIQQYKNNILELEWQIANINTDIAYVWDEARAMLGSSAPESLVSAYISQQTKHLQRQLMTYQNSLLVEQGKLDNAIDSVKTQLDYYAKWMDIWIDALKTLMWGFGSSSSSSSSSSKWIQLPVSEETVWNILDKMKDWTFSWKFDSATLKNLWLENTDTAEILRAVAQNMAITEDSDDLLAIKENTSSANYQKILKSFLEVWGEDIRKSIKSLSDAYSWIKKYDIKESEGKELLKWLFSTADYNKLAKKLWWKETTAELESASWEALSWIINDMINWNFSWKFDDTTLKSYGLKGTEQTALLNAIARSLSMENLLAIKWQTSDANYQKLLTQYLSIYEWDLVKAFRGQSAVDLAEAIKMIWMTEKQWKKILENTWYDTNTRNKVYSLLWWTQEKTATDNTVNLWWGVINTASQKYVDTMSKAWWWVKTATDKVKQQYDQLSKWIMATPTSNYSANWQNIWGVASSYSELERIYNNANKLKFKGDSADNNKKNFMDWLISWYKSSNWNIWVKALNKIWENPAKVKIYLTWIFGNNYNKSGFSSWVEPLLKDSTLSKATINSVIGK